MVRFPCARTHHTSAVVDALAGLRRGSALGIVAAMYLRDEPCMVRVYVHVY